MENKVLEQKLVDILIFITLIGCLSWYSWNMKNDLVFLFTGKYTTAHIENIKKVGGYQPYSIRYAFYDEFAEKKKVLTDQIGGHFGKKIENGNNREIEIAYTKDRIYYLDIKTPTWRWFLLRFVFWMIIVWFGVYNVKCIVKGKPIIPIEGNNGSKEEDLKRTESSKHASKQGKRLPR